MHALYVVVNLYAVIVLILFFFFFQAEDGIRDHCVTGVQTCALPIYEEHEKDVDERSDVHVRTGMQDLRLDDRSEEHTSELQSHSDLVCRLLLEKKKNIQPEPRLADASRQRRGWRVRDCAWKHCHADS